MSAFLNPDHVWPHERIEAHERTFADIINDLSAQHRDEHVAGLNAFEKNFEAWEARLASMEARNV